MSNKNKLEQLRHSCEHVLTQAMQRLYPEIKMAMGPATDQGFYFDFDPAGHKISEDDFEKIEQEMNKIIKADLPFNREEVAIDKAREIFADNPYKQEWLDEIEEKNEKVVLYWTGPIKEEKPNPEKGFVDLCSGPHLNSTGEIGAFKLLSVAGAYWRGSEDNKMLTRIYGTAFTNKEELQKYLERIEQAKKRDHRKLGKKLNLFMFDEEVGQGLPIYLPNGAKLKYLLKNFALLTYFKKGYQLVSTPHIGQEKLWKKSGHLDFYAESMYGPMEIEGEKYRLKPMNCPFHVKIYNSQIRSYRDLPMKLTEMGTVYRYEKSGELHGITRPRGFTQDDAHVICTENQLKEELKNILELTEYMYKTLNLENLLFKLSIRDPNNMEKYIGETKDWNQAEEALKEVLNESGHSQYELDEGGAAFYGPKIDIDAVDSMNRRWQLSTIQVDFNLTKRFNMTYTGSDGEEHQPFMIHRALLGSLERFLGVYIEHTAGVFPTWIAPTQVVLIPIADRNNQYAQEKAAILKKEDIRYEIDDRAESMQKKIKEAEEQKIPYMLIIGDREMKNNNISVRKRGEEDLGTMSWDNFVAKLKKEIEKKL
jgi:threonyl-tRNA synthetase